MSLLENSRKQVFHVLCLLMLTLIAASTMVSIFTEGVRLKILKDLCMSCILFGGAALAIALGSMGVPNDVESRTIYPILARPVGRAQYIIGKFIGTLLTVTLGVVSMAVVFGILICSYERSFDPFLLAAIGFTLLEVGVIAAVATAVSTVATPAVTAVLTFLIYICGTIKIGYFGNMIERTGSGAAKSVYYGVYHLLPNLECFNLKNALVHQDAVPMSYLVQVGLYAICYAAFVLFLGSLCFSRKEV
ncbi:MAG: ABC transporter permease [Armatimonadetes bacterium]|nr:ABC transporter permease [Armatimonadota bacterium]